MLAPTPCSVAGCPDYAKTGGRGKCEKHIPPAFHNSTRRGRLPSDWNTRRLIVLRRDKGTCYLCGETGADTVDHVVPGDDHSLTNLAPVHDRTPPHCHRYKTAAEGQEARRGNRTKRRF